MTSAAEFSLPGSRSLGCLLIHGLTATPAEMRPLGEALAAQGFPVHAVRLAGHGTSLDDLARTRWMDWFASVEAGMAELSTMAPRQAAIGMSLGGLLALHLAVARPREVVALVLCGTPLLSPFRARIFRYAMQLPLLQRRYALIHKRGGGPDISDPVERRTSLSYPAMPLPAVLEFFRLQALVRRELRHVTQPTLLLHGTLDHTAPPRSLQVLRRRLGSRWIEAHFLARSWHIITLDVERDRVAELAADFLTRVSADLRA